MFAHIPDYSQYIGTPTQEREDDEEGFGRSASKENTLGPLKKRERKRLRESAGVNPKPSRERVAGRSNPKPKTSLPPKGAMRCLWGDDCDIQMAFDYTLDTIKGWKNHVAWHLTRFSQPAEDNVARGKMVICDWDGCGAMVERGYLFKHIVTHEVRFKLLCPHGCGVDIRDDNLERHLRSCAAYGQ